MPAQSRKPAPHSARLVAWTGHQPRQPLSRTRFSTCAGCEACPYTPSHPFAILAQTEPLPAPASFIRLTCTHRTPSGTRLICPLTARAPFPYPLHPSALHAQTDPLPATASSVRSTCCRPPLSRARFIRPPTAPSVRPPSDPCHSRRGAGSRAFQIGGRIPGLPGANDARVPAPTESASARRTKKGTHAMRPRQPRAFKRQLAELILPNSCSTIIVSSSS